MAKNVLTNESGNLVVTLPASKLEVELRHPKGKDLKAIDQYAKTATGDVDMLFFMAVLLSVQPRLDTETLDEMDAQDVTELGRVIGNFPAFRTAK